jgi:hypothetical protein
MTMSTTASSELHQELAKNAHSVTIVVQDLNSLFLAVLELTTLRKECHFQLIASLVKTIQDQVVPIVQVLDNGKQFRLVQKAITVLPVHLRNMKRNVLLVSNALQIQ